MISSFIQFFSSHSSTVHTHTKLHRRSFFANLFLLTGYILAVWFQVYEFHSRDRELIAIIIYFLAFSLLIISGIAELSVDLFSSIRTVEHGRYHSKSPLWNRVISVLFITMGVLDIVAFCFWIQEKLHSEKVLLLCSGYYLLIMSILVLFFQMKEPIDNAPDRIDFVANGLVFVDAVLNIVLRHLELSVQSSDDATSRMELAVVILFLITAVLYVSTDIFRIIESNGGGGRDTEKQQTVQSTTQEITEA